MGKLTEAQLRVLSTIVVEPNRWTPWCLGTRSCEILRMRGLVNGDHPFQGRYGYDPRLTATDAGRQAVKEQS